MPTATPSPIPTAAVETAGPDYVPFGHFLAKPGFDLETAPWVGSEASLYMIGHGPVTVTAEELFPGKEISAQQYTSIGTAARPLLAGLIEYRRPASGLDEQKYVTVLAAIDPVTQALLKTTEVALADREGAVENGLTGSNGNAASFTVTQPVSGNNFETVSTTHGYDAVTGKNIWEKPGKSTSQVVGAVVVIGNGKGTIPYDTEPCPRGTGVDVATGKTLYQVDFIDVSERCTDVDVGASASSAFLPGRSEHRRYVRIEEAGVQKAFVALTGSPVKLPEQILAVDPLSSLAAGEKASPDTEPIVVTDVNTGAVKWTLDAAKVGKLNASVLALYDGKLYLKTTDQRPVIDIATGKTVENDTARYPTGQVDGWTLWSDGELERNP